MLRVNLPKSEAVKKEGMLKPAPSSMVFCINRLLEVMWLVVNGLFGQQSTDDGRQWTVDG
jgi:hypothetical protein